MTFGLLAILLLLAGVILFAGELLLPTQGLLGVLGAGAILGMIIVCFAMHVWLGIAALAACAAATPLLGAVAVKIWPSTPLGRRMMLPPASAGAAGAGAGVRVGQRGVAISELRPMGTCEFEGLRVEATSEHGIVPPGSAVRIIALVNRRPMVRVI
jgi:membrane-bound ClpP family serine protease